MVDILVLGATGYSGRLVTRYLYAHPQRSSFTFALGARSESKLQALRRDIDLDDSVISVQVDVTIPQQVEEAVKLAKVVINTVGPFWKWGTHVVGMCAKHGKHYVDLTGETWWHREMLARFDHLATKTKAIIVPSCGLDSLPSDILVFLSNKTVKDTLGPDAEITRSQTFVRAKGSVSGGTLATFFTLLDDVPRSVARNSQSDYYLSFAIQGPSSPAKRLVYPEPFTSPTKYGSLWIMANSNRAIVQRTWGLHAIAASTSEDPSVKRLAYGNDFTYEESAVFARGRIPAMLYSLGIIIGTVVLTVVTPIRRLVQRYVTQPGDGPSDKELEEGFLQVTNYSTAKTPSSTSETHVRSIMHGHGDPGYLLSSIMVAECALALVFDKASLPPLAHGGGFLTPASAFGDVAVTRLERTGRMKFETKVLGS